MKLLPDLQTGILLARRARYLSTSLWLLLAVLGLAIMAGQFSGRQPATVALDVGLSVMRLALPLLIILLVQELISREFDRRYILSSLTYPRPRHRLLLGRVATVLLLSSILLLIMGVALAGIVSQIGMGYEQKTPISLGTEYWITLVFIAIDLFVITSIATLIAVVAATPSFVLIGTLGFMLIARSYSSIIALLQRERYLLDNTDQYQQSLAMLHYLLPDLGALDMRMITLYDKLELLPAEWPENLIATVAYGVTLLAMALFFLHRKQFN